MGIKLEQEAIPLKQGRTSAAPVREGTHIQEGGSPCAGSAHSDILPQEAELLFAEDQRGILLQTVCDGTKNEIPADRAEDEMQTDRAKDLAVLTSPQGQRSGWTLEADCAEWEALLNWLPLSVKAKDIGGLLDSLSTLYLSVQSSIGRHTAAAQAAKQYERLFEALGAALNRFFPSALEFTDSYFEKHGDAQLKATLRRSVLYLVTGNVLPEKEVEAYLSGKSRSPDSPLAWRESGHAPRPAAGKAEKNVYFSQPSSAGPREWKNPLSPSGRGRDPAVFHPDRPSRESSFSSVAARDCGTPAQISGSEPARGTFYSPHEPSHRTPPAHAAYLKQVQNAKLALTPQAGGGTGIRVSKRTVPDYLYDANDLEHSESFFRYLSQGGDLFKHPEFCLRDETLLGLAQAVMTIKGQQFALSPEVRSAMGAAVRTIVERLVDCHMRQAEPLYLKEHPQSSYDRGNVNAAYYFIMREYIKQNDMREAVSRGFQYYSASQDKKKQENVPNKGSALTKSESRESQPAQPAQGQNFSDFRERLRDFLERDLENYRRSLRKKPEKPDYRSRYALSPWGMTLSPGREIFNAGKSVLWIFTALGCAAVLFLLFAS